MWSGAESSCRQSLFKLGSSVGACADLEIDATVPVEVATEVAVRAESAGYASFWVNGSPPYGALDIVEEAAQHTDLDLGVGVFPLTAITAEELISQIRQRGLPEDRLWLGVGSGRKSGALGEVRRAAGTVRTELDVRVVTAAVGPKMTELAGDIADAVVFTWWMASEVTRSRVLLDRSAAAAGRKTPTVVSFIRCALLPQAAAAIAERAAVYDAIPRYREVFARNQLAAADTVITGTSRAELLAGIEIEEAVVDHPVIRAITETATVEAIAELLTACAPAG